MFNSWNLSITDLIQNFILGMWTWVETTGHFSFTGMKKKTYLKWTMRVSRLSFNFNSLETTDWEKWTTFKQDFPQKTAGKLLKIILFTVWESVYIKTTNWITTIILLFLYVVCRIWCSYSWCLNNVNNI